MKRTEARKVAKAVLDGLSLEETKLMAKILMTDNEILEKQIGHSKEEAVRNFAKLSLDRQRKGI